MTINGVEETFNNAICIETQSIVPSYNHLFESIAFNHRPRRVWQQRVYCHAIKEAETTLTIKLQRRAGGYKGKRKLWTVS